MKINPETYSELARPTYILNETKLRRNLEIISRVSRLADVEIILAFKAYALWRTFPIFREYIGATTASSLNEARLGFEEFGVPTHTFSPAYEDSEIEEIARCSSHIVFNSMSQYERFREQVRQANRDISIGLRLNPEYSEVATLLYNPCAPGTRFGIASDKLPKKLPDDVKGFHIHCHCESGSDVFARTLKHFEARFSPWLEQVEWMNFGGGHLMTRKDYDIQNLIDILTGFRQRYPHLKIIMEPGSAFAWQTGELVSQIVDIVEHDGIKTAILNVSFTCHMPDCLEMPYQPEVRRAKIVDDTNARSPRVYRLGGNSCLSGDWMGYWQFDHDLQVGENIIFEDMLHYTTVKTNMFNGIPHPDIALLHADGGLETLRRFTYEDYRSRMD
jgi:carboxynorspermidine decarboxylase